MIDSPNPWYWRCMMSNWMRVAILINIAQVTDISLWPINEYEILQLCYVIAVFIRWVLFIMTELKLNWALRNVQHSTNVSVIKNHLTSYSFPITIHINIYIHIYKFAGCNREIPSMLLVESGAAITRPSITWYCIHHCSDWGRIYIRVLSHKIYSIARSNGLWVVFVRIW